MTHPLLAAAAETERQIAWELDGIGKGIDRLKTRMARVERDGGYIAHERKTQRELAELVALGGLIGKLARTVRGW